MRGGERERHTLGNAMRVSSYQGGCFCVGMGVGWEREEDGKAVWDWVGHKVGSRGKGVQYGLGIEWGERGLGSGRRENGRGCGMRLGECGGCDGVGEGVRKEVGEERQGWQWVPLGVSQGERGYERGGKGCVVGDR